MLSMWMTQLAQHGNDFDFSLDDSDESMSFAWNNQLLGRTYIIQLLSIHSFVLLLVTPAALGCFWTFKVCLQRRHIVAYRL